MWAAEVTDLFCCKRCSQGSYWILSLHQNHIYNMQKYLLNIANWSENWKCCMLNAACAVSHNLIPKGRVLLPGLVSWTVYPLCLEEGRWSQCYFILKKFTSVFTGMGKVTCSFHRDIKDQGCSRRRRREKGNEKDKKALTQRHKTWLALCDGHNTDAAWLLTWTSQSTGSSCPQELMVSTAKLAFGEHWGYADGQLLFLPEHWPLGSNRQRSW